MKRQAVAYLRVSTKAQTYEQQLPPIERYCEAQEWELVTVFYEKESGAAYETRKALQGALELIEAGCADALLTATSDRLARDVGVAQKIHERLCRVGAEYISVASQTPGSPEDVFNQRIRALFESFIGERQ